MNNLTTTNNSNWKIDWKEPGGTVEQHAPNDEIYKEWIVMLIDALAGEGTNIEDLKICSGEFEEWLKENNLI